MAAGAFLHSQFAAENVIDGCEFSGNSTLRNGGGLQIEAFDLDDGTTITDSLFDSNVAGAEELAGGGGGIHSVCYLYLSGVAISNNVASFGGGAWTSADADDKTEVHGNATESGGYATVAGVVHPCDDVIELQRHGPSRLAVSGASDGHGDLITGDPGAVGGAGAVMYGGSL